MTTADPKNLLTPTEFNEAVQTQLKTLGHFPQVHPSTLQSFHTFRQFENGALLAASDVEPYAKKLLAGLEHAETKGAGHAKLFLQDLATYKNMLKTPEGTPYKLTEAECATLKQSALSDYKHLLDFETTTAGKESKSLLSSAYRELRNIGFTKAELQNGLEEAAAKAGPSSAAKDLIFFKGLEIEKTKNPESFLPREISLTKVEKTATEAAKKTDGRKWFQFLTHDGEGLFSGKRTAVSAVILAAVGGLALTNRKRAEEPEQTASVQR